MGDCSKCGKKAMTFTCRYCGDKFCSEHRLPENHDCEGLDEKLEEEKKDSKKQWFDDKESKEEQEERTVEASTVRNSTSIIQSVKRSLMSNYTLAIIALTVLSFVLHEIFPALKGFLTLSPALSQAAVEATNNAIIAYNETVPAAGQLPVPFLEKSLVYTPWTIVTVMLAHQNLFHLLANMVTFYFFGTAVEKAVGGRKMVKMYIISGIAASLSYIAFRNVIFQLYGPINGLVTLSPAVGASGAVVAMVGVTAMLYPEAEVLLYFVIPMKIKTAVYAFGGLEAFNLVAKILGYQLPLIGAFASSAHLAGLLMGLWFGKKLRDRYRKQTGVFNPLGY